MVNPVMCHLYLKFPNINLHLLHAVLCEVSIKYNYTEGDFFLNTASLLLWL